MNASKIFLSIFALIISMVNAVRISGFPGEPYGGCTNNNQLRIALPDRVKNKVSYVKVEKKLDLIKALAAHYNGRILYDANAGNCFKEVEIRTSKGKTATAVIADICYGGCYDGSKSVFVSLGGAPQLTGSVEGKITYREPNKSVLEGIFKKIGGDSIFNQ